MRTRRFAVTVLGRTMAVLGLLVGAAEPAAADEIIINGNFEQGNVGFASDYRFSPGNILDLQTYDIVRDPHLSHFFATSYGDHTTGAGLMMAVNGALIPGAVVWTETVTVRPNASYNFSTWVSSWDNISPARLDFLFNDVSVGTFTAPSVAGVWQQFAATWDSGANSSLTIKIIDRNTDFSGNDFALDDVSLQGPGTQVVPEPSSLTLFVIGVVGFVGYRKRRCR